MHCMMRYEKGHTKRSQKTLKRGQPPFSKKELLKKGLLDKIDGLERDTINNLKS